ncbi:MAG: adenosine deaminase [Myxococcales bacterium]|nr:adenosine deaminase [Myxococcales bacterium]
MTPDERRAFVRALPKAELHLHVEGTLEPELAFALAAENGVSLRFESVEAMRAAYEFEDLQSFLDLYYEACRVLLREEDFFRLGRAYLDRAAADGVRHAEIFFDPQSHTSRGVPFEAVLDGLERALADAEARHGISGGLILCFLRHLSEEDAQAALDEAWPHRERLIGVGLDSSERGHPPSKFERVFARAREGGLLTFAHAGEEGPPSYVTEALDLLKVTRIDHGVRAAEDPALVARLAKEKIPLTVCPLSNVRLCVYDRLEDHPLKRLLDAGVRVTVHSDDPAYFGGYVLDNYLRAAEALDLSEDDLRRLARCSIEASVLSDARRAALLAELEGVRAFD